MLTSLFSFTFIEVTNLFHSVILSDDNLNPLNVMSYNSVRTMQMPHTVEFHQTRWHSSKLSINLTSVFSLTGFPNGWFEGEGLLCDSYSWLTLQLVLFAGLFSTLLSSAYHSASVCDGFPNGSNVLWFIAALAAVGELNKSIIRFHKQEVNLFLFCLLST